MAEIRKSDPENLHIYTFSSLVQSLLQNDSILNNIFGRQNHINLGLHLIKIAERFHLTKN